MLLSNFTFRCTLNYIVSVAFCSRQILDRKIQFWGKVGVKGTKFAFKLTLRGGRTYGRFSQSQSFLDANVTNTENFLTHGAPLRALRNPDIRSSFQDGPSKQKNADSKTSGYDFCIRKEKVADLKIPGYVWMVLYPDFGCFSISMSMVAALELDIKHLALSIPFKFFQRQ